MNMSNFFYLGSNVSLSGIRLGECHLFCTCYLFYLTGIDAML